MSSSEVRLRSMPRAAVISFGSSSPLWSCSPPLLPRLAPPAAVLAGAGLADRIAVSEMWLDDGALVADLDDSTRVRVAATRVGAEFPDLDVHCSACAGPDVCAHAVAALLCAHGAAGTAGRLVDKST